LEAYVGSSEEIVREFLVESYENLDQLDQDLVALEGKPGSRDILSRVFRTIHTVKLTFRTSRGPFGPPLVGLVLR
jgi:two-component system chemotaxis sensor kinase CheA